MNVTAGPGTLDAISSAASPPARDGGRRRRQLAALFGLETRRNLLARRAAGLYVLAALPVALVAALAVARAHGVGPLFGDPQSAAEVVAGIFDALILRTVIFFGCGWLFVALVRGELATRSLHYIFLTPLPRTSILLGKYGAGCAVSFLLFGGATLATLALAGWPGGAGQTLAYLGIAVLACMAYGALFSLLGLLFVNPVFPILAVYGWEWINFLLPPLLQRLSVLHYLQALAPLPPAVHSIAFIAPPTTPAAAIATLLVLSAALAWLSALRMRRVEVNYGQQD